MVWLADPHLIPPHVEWQRGHALQTIEYTASEPHTMKHHLPYSGPHPRVGAWKAHTTRTCLTCDRGAADPFEAAVALLLGSRTTRMAPGAAHVEHSTARHHEMTYHI